jgi:hypothetical protein
MVQAAGPARSPAPAAFSRSMSERPPTPPQGDLRRASSDAPGRSPSPLHREDSATNLAEVTAPSDTSAVYRQKAWKENLEPYRLLVRSQKLARSPRSPSTGSVTGILLLALGPASRLPLRSLGACLSWCARPCRGPIWLCGVRRLRLLWGGGGRLGSAGRATASSGCRPPLCPHGAAGLAAHSRTGPGGGAHCPAARETATWLLFLSAFRPGFALLITFSLSFPGPVSLSCLVVLLHIHSQADRYLLGASLPCLSPITLCVFAAARPHRPARRQRGVGVLSRGPLAACCTWCSFRLSGR